MINTLLFLEFSGFGVGGHHPAAGGSSGERPYTPQSSFNHPEELFGN